MAITSPRLRRLDDALASLPEEGDPRPLGELDGFIAGVIARPAPIPRE